MCNVLKVSVQANYPIVSFRISVASLTFCLQDLSIVVSLVLKSPVSIYVFRCSYIQFSSVAQSCPTLCDAMNCSTPGLPVHHRLPEFPKLMSIESVTPSNHLIVCRPFLLPPSIFPSIRIFSNESALRTRWPKHWSFSFSFRPSSEYNITYLQPSS